MIFLYIHLLIGVQITVMNASSILGRTVPNFLADIYGPLNGWQFIQGNSIADLSEVLIPSGLISGALVFAMLGASTIGGVAAFGICYGFFSGGSELLSCTHAMFFIFIPDISSYFRCYACHCVFCHSEWLFWSRVHFLLTWNLCDNQRALLSACESDCFHLV